MRQTSALKQIARRYAHVRESFNERARRLFVASEAVAYGYGGISVVSRATGVARRTIGLGIAELRQIEGGWTPPWGPSAVAQFLEQPRHHLHAPPEGTFASPEVACTDSNSA